MSLDAGFDSSHVLTLTPVVLGTRGMTAAAMLNEKRQMVDVVRTLPRVTAAAMVSELPLTHITPFAYAIEGRAIRPGQAAPIANMFWVEGDYFSALRFVSGVDAC